MSITFASLGIYEEGDIVTYTVVCLSNEGARDPDCTEMSNDILSPTATARISAGIDLAEVSDANFPGLWRGNYTINVTEIGTWGIYLQLTNANSTAGSTVLNFEVVDSKWATQQNVTDLNNSNTNIINHGDNDWTTGTGNITGASCVNVDDKTGYTIASDDNGDVICTQTNITDNIPFPAASVVTDIDLSKSGLINTSAYDAREPQHFTGDEATENSIEMKDTWYVKNYVTLTEIPSNMTNAYVRYWLRKTGSPTGVLAIYIDGNEVYNHSDVSALSTSMTFFEQWFEPDGNITDTFLEIKFVGEDAWTNANKVEIGAGHLTGAVTYTSTDGITWTDAQWEIPAGIVLEFNQKSFQDQLGIDVLINQSRDIDNETRIQIISIDEGINTTLGSNVIPEIQAINTTLTDNVITILEDSTSGLLALYNYLVNIITAGIDGVSKGVDDNRTALNNSIDNIIDRGDNAWVTNDTGVYVLGDENGDLIATQTNATSGTGATQTQVDVMINNSRDIENETRIQIIDHGDNNWTTFTGTATATTNNTAIAQAVLDAQINKTITYNYAWNLVNITTTYDDLGWIVIETLAYNDTSNKWHLNSTEARRTA